MCETAMCTFHIYYINPSISIHTHVTYKFENMCLTTDHLTGERNRNVVCLSSLGGVLASTLMVLENANSNDGMNYQCVHALGCTRV